MCLDTGSRLPVALTWRALGMRMYRMCVWECTARLLFAVTCSYTRVAVVGSNNTPTYCLARLPPFDKSAPCIFNSSYVRYPPLSGIEVKERVR